MDVNTRRVPRLDLSTLTATVETLPEDWAGLVGEQVADAVADNVSGPELDHYLVPPS